MNSHPLLLDSVGWSINVGHDGSNIARGDGGRESKVQSGIRAVRRAKGVVLTTTRLCWRCGEVVKERSK